MMFQQQAPVGEIWHSVLKNLWLFAMLGATTAACSMMPSANLSLFSLKLPIIIMEVTNVLLRESLLTRSQENVETLSSQDPLVGRVWHRSLYSIF